MDSYSTPLDEYKKLTRLLESDAISKKDVYNELMNKEANTLTLINRVVDHEQEKQYNNKLFYNMPLLTVLALFISTWKTILVDLSMLNLQTDYMRIGEIFLKKDRKIYLGFTIILVALFVYIADII